MGRSEHFVRTGRREATEGVQKRNSFLFLSFSFFSDKRKEHYKKSIFLHFTGRRRRRRQHTCFAYVLIPPVSATPTHMLRICVNSPCLSDADQRTCVHWSIPPVSATPTNALRALVNSPNTPSGYRPLSPFQREPLLHLSLY